MQLNASLTLECHWSLQRCT